MESSRRWLHCFIFLFASVLGVNRAFLWNTTTSTKYYELFVTSGGTNPAIVAFGTGSAAGACTYIINPSVGSGTMNTGDIQKLSGQGYVAFYYKKITGDGFSIVVALTAYMQVCVLMALRKITMNEITDITGYTQF